MIDRKSIKIDSVYWDGQFVEVYYRTAPEWFSRVSVYPVEEIISSYNGDKRDPYELTVGTDFITEEINSMMEMDIEEFHCKQLGLYRTDTRKIKILERIINQFKTKVR